MSGQSQWVEHNKEHHCVSAVIEEVKSGFDWKLITIITNNWFLCEWLQKIASKMLSHKVSDLQC